VTLADSYIHETFVNLIRTRLNATTRELLATHL
jgi:hypothetical protein